MGQKINPNIFRLGINKNWKTEFFEKKKHELPLYTFKSLEIESYIKRFLELQGLVVQKYKQHYSNSTLTFYISYSILPDFISNKKSKISKFILTNQIGESKIIKDAQIPAINCVQGYPTRLFRTNPTVSYYQMKKYLKNHPSSNTFSSKKFDTDKVTFSHQKITGVLSNFFKVLSLFTHNRFNIIVHFSCLNRNFSFLKKTQKKNFTLLQKFKGTSFLKEGIEVLFYIINTKNSASLLAKFIAMQMKKVKRHKFFLSFLKQALTSLMNSTFSKVKGIKIVVKGRLNGVPRAKHKVITVGDIPAQSISSVIDYAQATTHNLNGSYGIKVWIVEKT